jgi:hypothetical protein
MQKKRKKQLALLVATLTATSGLYLTTTNASASHIPLGTSHFEIDTDANLKVDHDPVDETIDWGTPGNDCAPGEDKNCEIRKTEEITGNGDDSFGQGTKEDSAVPTIVTGSIPPNKSDLESFGVYQEGTTSDGFLNLFWSRVQDPSGTTNMDFELNRRQCTPGLDPADPDCSSNGLTPIRSVGDRLITYDLSKGGTQATMRIRSWTGSAWGGEDVLDATEAVGTINTSPISAGDADGLGSLSPRTFGEAGIKLSVLLGTNGCEGFGSAYLKSRASDSFTAAVKDFVAPVPVSISNCGTVNIVKTDDAGNPLPGATFTLWTDVTRGEGDTQHDETTQDGDASDIATQFSCTTVVVGNEASCSMAKVPNGFYWVVETTGVAGYDKAPDQALHLTAAATVTLPFVNPRQHRVIVIVCHEGTNTLAPSDVTRNDANPKTTIGSVPSGALASKGVTEADLCGIGGASYSGISGHPIDQYDVDIASDDLH